MKIEQELASNSYSRALSAQQIRDTYQVKRKSIFYDFDLHFDDHALIALGAFIASRQAEKFLFFESNAT